MRTFFKLSALTFVLLAGFAYATPVEAAQADYWPSWIGELDDSSYSTVVRVVDFADFPELPEAQVVNIPTHYQPLHYSEFSNVRYMFFPDELIQAGGTSDVDQWPSWISAPYWMY